MSYDSTLSPYAGDTAMSDAAGVRTDPAKPGRKAQHVTGGLLHEGTRVDVSAPGRNGLLRGPIVDTGSVPAPFIAIENENIVRSGVELTVIFLGPGVFITPAYGSEHPAL